MPAVGVKVVICPAELTLSGLLLDDKITCVCRLLEEKMEEGEMHMGEGRRRRGVGMQDDKKGHYASLSLPSASLVLPIYRRDTRISRGRGG